MQDKIKKEEVEELLGYCITESQFLEALEYAKRKQEYIYKTTQRKVVLKQWYLIRLTMEYVRNLEFSRMTITLCQELDHMKREYPKKKGTPNATILYQFLVKKSRKKYNREVILCKIYQFKKF